MKIKDVISLLCSRFDVGEVRFPWSNLCSGLVDLMFGPIRRGRQSVVAKFATAF